MMNFILLGSGPGKPSLEKHLSAIYVELRGKRILFDCGDGTYRRLMEHSLHCNELDAIVISHYHPDHICGIFMVLQMLYLEGRTKPLRLFLPERPQAFLDTLHMFYTFEEKFPFTLDIHLVDELPTLIPEISPSPNDHLHGYEPIIRKLALTNPMQSYSFVIQGDRGNLVYTADLDSCDNLDPLLANCDTLIIDAIHPDAAKITRLEAFPIRRILLNHGISEELDNWLGENSTSRLEIALEDTIYRL